MEEIKAGIAEMRKSFKVQETGEKIREKKCNLYMRDEMHLKD